MARRKTPAFLHVAGMNAHHRTRLEPGCRDRSPRQLSGTSGLADPIASQAPFALARGNLHVAAKANAVAKSQLLNELKQLDVTEPSIRDNGHSQSRRQGFLQPGQAEVLKV